MKLLRVGPVGHETPAVLVDGNYLDVSSVVGDFDGAGLSPGSLATVRQALAACGLPVLDPDSRIGAPIARPGKIICIGVNYADHAAESNLPIPTEPVVFMKDPYTVIGPNDEVLIPRKSLKTDWEVELGVVIGSTARYLDSAEDALACVAGYAVSQDLSEREFQLERGGQWDKGKSCETFNPLGPWLVTPDEIVDPQLLGLQLWVDGNLRQDGNTSSMVFGVGEIIRYLSQVMVLHPGDLINSGTPAGVALGFPDPKPYLRAGQTIELTIDGLGRQRQEVGQA